jgi:hypothetical protein
MNKPHVHAEVIKAWADGAVIEWRAHSSHEWKDAPYPKWSNEVSYRIKPTPKPDIHTWGKLTLGEGYDGSDVANLYYRKVQEEANVKCVFDGETHELKEVVVL